MLILVLRYDLEAQLWNFGSYEAMTPGDGDWLGRQASST